MMTKDTTRLLAGILGSMIGINRRLARALSAKLDDEWIAAIRSAPSVEAARTYFENAVNEATERLLAEVEGDE